MLEKTGVLTYRRPMFIPQIALYAFVGINITVFLGALYAHARVRANEKVLEQLDWETLADLTGQVGALKRSLQKTNGRISGMTASDPISVLGDLPVLQQQPQQTNGQMKGG